MEEIWKTHPSLGIMVSNLGRVETRNLGKHFGSDCKGYKQIKWKGKIYYIHILVYETFNNIIVPNGYEVHHDDKNRSNNNIGNLVLLTKEEHKALHSKPVNQYTKDIILVREWSSTHEAERLCGFNNQHISSCCNGKRKSHGGYVWRYK